MKLFLIEQSQNLNYWTYDSAVVAAANEETARNMHPGTGMAIKDWSATESWCDGPHHVRVRYIGEAADDVEQGSICSSYNAG